MYLHNALVRQNSIIISTLLERNNDLSVRKLKCRKKKVPVRIVLIFIFFQDIKHCMIFHCEKPQATDFSYRCEKTALFLRHSEVDYLELEKRNANYMERAACLRKMQ